MRFGGIVCAVALTLGACSSDPAPREPSPSASSTSASPTATPPTMPPQASEDSLEGAAAFVKHYVDVFNYAAATGDVAELRSISKGCKSCGRYASDFERLEESERPNGAAWTLGDVSVASGNSGRQVAATIVSLGEADRPYELVFDLPLHPPFNINEVTDRTP